jgi:hypothetical protein
MTAYPCGGICKESVYQEMHVDIHIQEIY